MFHIFLLSGYDITVTV